MPSSPPTAPSTADAETLARLLRRRASCRGFRPDPVPMAVIEAMLEMAQRTASWCNCQPWRVAVTSGEGTERLRAALFEAASASVAPEPDLPFPAAYTGVRRERRREAGFRLYDALGIGRGDRAAAEAQMLENFRFFGAPHVAIVSAPAELGVYGAVDCGGYVANLMLAAEAHGVASIAQAALAMQAPLLRRLLALPDDHLVVCGVSFGYADPAHPANAVRTSRAQLSENVTFMSE